MIGYDASVLNSPKTRLLLVAPNWLGDGIMAMPAIQELKNCLHAQATISVAARPNQIGLWEMQPVITEVITLPAKTKDLIRSASLLKNKNFTHVVILPHSFRSAFVCALAGITHRRGTICQSGRKWLINDPVSLHDLKSQHQQWEIARLILPKPLPSVLPAPRIQPAPEAVNKAATLIDHLPRPILACIPGAARGPSKQWPGERFQAVAKSWIEKTQGSVCWLGTPADVDLCEALSSPLGVNSLSLAGKTHLQVFTALLKQMDQSLVNDSGGMHLAAAVGTPLVAIFGNTDPAKTGPLSVQARVLQKSDQKNRSIKHLSEDAQAALARITVAEVLEPTLAKHI